MRRFIDIAADQFKRSNPHPLAVIWSVLAPLAAFRVTFPTAAIPYKPFLIVRIVFEAVLVSMAVVIVVSPHISVIVNIFEP